MSVHICLIGIFQSVTYSNISRLSIYGEYKCSLQNGSFYLLRISLYSVSLELFLLKCLALIDTDAFEFYLLIGKQTATSL